MSYQNTNSAVEGQDLITYFRINNIINTLEDMHCVVENVIQEFIYQRGAHEYKLCLRSTSILSTTSIDYWCWEGPLKEHPDYPGPLQWPWPVPKTCEWICDFPLVFWLLPIKSELTNSYEFAISTSRDEIRCEGFTSIDDFKSKLNQLLFSHASRLGLFSK